MRCHDGSAKRVNVCFISLSPIICVCVRALLGKGVCVRVCVDGGCRGGLRRTVTFDLASEG